MYNYYQQICLFILKVLKIKTMSLIKQQNCCTIHSIGDYYIGLNKYIESMFKIVSFFTPRTNKIACL